jgi:hypothetical protein
LGRSYDSGELLTKRSLAAQDGWIVPALSAAMQENNERPIRWILEE